MSQDERRRLHEAAAALTMEEWEIFIQHYDDDSLWEELRRRFASVKDERDDYRRIERKYREVY